MPAIQGRQDDGQGNAGPGRPQSDGVGTGGTQGVLTLDPSQLSRRIGQGRTAEIFRLQDGRIIKLLSSRVPVQRVKRELKLARDRKSTRLNSSHVAISYAVFCLKKKKMLNHSIRHFRDM